MAPKPTKTMMNRVIPVDDAQPDEIEAIRQGKRDLSLGETFRLEDLQNELGVPLDQKA